MLRYGEALALASFTGREVDVQENANNRKRLPEWIGELPTDAQRAEWARQAINYFTTPQVAILRGQIPARLEAETAYTDPELFKPPDSASDAIRANYESTKIRLSIQNVERQKLRDNQVAEIKDQIGRDLSVCMETNAPTALAALLAKHTNATTKRIDGHAMFIEMRDTRSKETTELSNEAADKELQRMEKDGLPDGCPGEQVSNYFQDFMVRVNPYTSEPKNEEAQVRWMRARMPPSTVLYHEMGIAKLEAAGTDKTVAAVVPALMLACHRTLTHLEKIGSASSSSGAFVGAATPGVPATPRSGTGTLFVRKPLPSGQKCEEGTCNYQHVGPCWVNAKFDGYISKKAYADKTPLAAENASALRRSPSPPRPRPRALLGAAHIPPEGVRAALESVVGEEQKLRSPLGHT